jgi:hypothetical protein
VDDSRGDKGGLISSISLGSGRVTGLNQAGQQVMRRNLNSADDHHPAGFSGSG